MHRIITCLGGLSLSALIACTPTAPMPEPGVSLALAQHRAETLSDIAYDLTFTVPKQRTSAVTGTAVVHVTRSAPRRTPLVLDFRGDTAGMGGVVVNGTVVTPTITNGHIIIPGSALVNGRNTIALSFVAADDALNRNADFLYALFVPDRAATAFPSFDQPDLKARVTLTLDTPVDWTTVANGSEQSVEADTVRARRRFATTEPLPTYLITFAAGRFAVDSAQRDGRWMTMLHRETDSLRVQRNRDAIYDLHATALRWLEEYTGIPYPFEKFGFAAIPAFQFGGMEHPGAVWYRASSLFLDETATQAEQLGRASLIAHETAHMWFGDFVTMRWFDDVWMKEVFANFMAAKIVEPSFPEVDHALRFLLAHHPSAYAVDRTEGANPIRQPLENLRGAGSLYGAIIYQKAPIVMRQLEQRLGAQRFRDGLRTYLSRYRYANATWTDLIDIFDALTDEDLRAWSRAWVEEAGRPIIRFERIDTAVVFSQRDADTGRNLRWSQRIGVTMGTSAIASRGASGNAVRNAATSGVRSDAGSIVLDAIDVAGADAVALSVASPVHWVLPGTDGVSYARFVLDSSSREALLREAPSMAPAVTRAVAYLTLWEELLSGAIAPRRYLEFSTTAIRAESDELIRAQLLTQLRTVYWRYLAPDDRRAVAPAVEMALWNALQRVTGTGARSALWSTYVAVAQSAAALQRVQRAWSGAAQPLGVPFSESQQIAMVEALALRDWPVADSLLTAQRARITNPDRRARFDFVRPALSPDVSARDSVVASFAEVENRSRESWVLDALSAAVHPLRAPHSARYIMNGLALAEEIQNTGDIFFPLGWMQTLLSGQQSAEAADSVSKFLAKPPGMPPRLRGKLLQAADDVFRSATLVHGWQGRPLVER